MYTATGIYENEKRKKKQTRDPITICLLSVDLWWSTKELQTQWHMSERKIQ